MNATSLPSHTIQIKSTQIIQLILQYLYENNFQKSFRQLQQQSKVTLNQIHNQKQFLQAFKDKNWAKVVQDLQGLMLSQELFFATYQYIVDSLIENDQFQAASLVLKEVIIPNIKQMSQYRQRIMRIQFILQHPQQKNLYKTPPSQPRQATLLQQLLSTSNQAHPSRLLTLLSQSLQLQSSLGHLNPSISLNLFTGVQSHQTIESQVLIKQIEKTIAYSEESKIMEIKISWSEEYLAVAGVDGLIELYNMSDFSLYDNEYQRQGSMFFHDHPIQQVEFNYQDQMLASLDSTGLVNIWNLQNGKLLRKIDKETNVNVICWGIDPSHFLIGYKQKVKLYGIRSCNVLKQYNLSNSQYLSHLFVSDSRLYCISHSGSLTIFNYISQQQTFLLQTKQVISSCIRLFPSTSSHLFNRLLLSFQKRICQVDQFGAQVRTYSIEDGEVEKCVGVGNYLYVGVRGLDGKGRMSVVDRQRRKVVYFVAIDAPFEHMVMSRKRNLLITYDHQHKLSFWRPG